jgi:hypothetical protein
MGRPVGARLGHETDATADEHRPDPPYLRLVVVGTGVDPVTSRFSGEIRSSGPRRGDLGEAAKAQFRRKYPAG